MLHQGWDHIFSETAWNFNVNGSLENWSNYNPTGAITYIYNQYWIGFCEKCSYLHVFLKTLRSRLIFIRQGQKYVEWLGAPKVLPWEVGHVSIRDRPWWWFVQVGRHDDWSGEWSVEQPSRKGAIKHPARQLLCFLVARCLPFLECLPRSIHSLSKDEYHYEQSCFAGGKL